MLLDVLRFDVLLNRKILLLNVAIFLVFLLFMAHDAKIPAREYAVIGALMFSFTALSILSREDKFKARVLLCSLPVPRRQIVLARYSLAIGAGLAGIAIACGLAALPSAQVVTKDATVWSVLTPALVTVAIANAVLLPFTIRFGMVGILVFLAGAQVLGLIALAASSFARRRLHLGDIIGRFGSALHDLERTTGATTFGALVALLLLAALAISCRISIAIYERQEL